LLTDDTLAPAEAPAPPARAAGTLRRPAAPPRRVPLGAPLGDDGFLPLVSIVIASHNYEAYVDAAISSALGQTYPLLEVIVVDDGSEDGSPARIRAWGDRIRAVFRPNGGQAAAWNTGWRAARGDVVMFLDADDQLLPEAVERAVRAFRPGMSKVQFPLQVIDRQGVPQPALYPPFELAEGDMRRRLLSQGYYPSAPTSGNAFRRAALDAIFPIPEQPFRIGADGYVIAITGLLGTVGRLDRISGYYRRHEANRGPAGRMTLERMRGEMLREAERSRRLERFAATCGLSAKRDLCLRLPSHVRNRLYSRAVDPKGHPWPGDRRPVLALMGLRALWLAPDRSRRKKIAAGLGFLVMAALPKPIMRRFGPWILEPEKRPAWLRRLMR